MAANLTPESFRRIKNAFLLSGVSYGLPGYLGEQDNIAQIVRRTNVQVPPEEIPDGPQSDVFQLGKFPDTGKALREVCNL